MTNRHLCKRYSYSTKLLRNKSLLPKTETALHDVVGSFEGVLNKKLYVLASFLDIEYAFINVKI